MIYDTIENLAQYAPILSGLEKAAAFRACLLQRLGQKFNLVLRSVLF